MRWWKVLLIIVVSIVLVIAGIIWYIKRPILSGSVNENSLPQFVQADFIDLSRVASISKFRSASGHDFSSHGETCRSMKHYFTPPRDENKGFYQPGDPPPPAPDLATGTPIYSPVDGVIISVSEEHTPIGKQFEIRPSSAPSFSIRLFHVYPIDGVKPWSRVKAGQRIGSIGDNQSTDIAVQAATVKGDQFVSYFQVMPDSVFARYQSRGIVNRNELIITKAERDADPLECTGNREEQFATNYQSDPNYDEEVYLSGYSRPNYENFRNVPQENKNSQ